jgi:hypothetical protein
MALTTSTRAPFFARIMAGAAARACPAEVGIGRTSARGALDEDQGLALVEGRGFRCVMTSAPASRNSR